MAPSTMPLVGGEWPSFAAPAPTKRARASTSGNVAATCIAPHSTGGGRSHASPTAPTQSTDSLEPMGSGAPTVHLAPCENQPVTTPTSPPPFIAEELERLPDPLSVNFLCQLSCRLVLLIPTLPRDGPDDARAQVLQFIVESVRVDGFRTSFFFQEKSLEDLRAILQRDDALSDAIGKLFRDNYFAYGQALVLVLRHVCRRTPSKRQSHSVQFAEETQSIEADDAPEEVDSSASYSDDSPRVFPPFVVEEMLEILNPFDPGPMAHLTVLTMQHAKVLTGDPDDDVRLAQFLLDTMHQMELVSSDSASNDSEKLRNCVRQDELLSDSLHALLSDTTVIAVQRLFPIIRYVHLLLRGVP